MTAAPHIPGVNARPREGSIAPGLEAGLALYRAGYFWEAHEAWEPVWLEAAHNSPERALLQGLIQLTNARLKQVIGREKAVARIIALAEEHLAAAGQSDLAIWAQTEVESCRTALLQNSAK